MLRIPFLLFVLVAAATAPLAHGAKGVQYDVPNPYPRLTVATGGVDPFSALFPAAAYVPELCLYTAGTPATYPCKSIAATSSCLSKSALVSALSSQPEVLASLVARFGTKIRLQTLPGPSNLINLEIIRILLSEVLGYHVQVVIDPSFAQQLQQCTKHMFDLHNWVYKIDYKATTLWQDTFITTEKASCKLAGASGFTGHNQWYADTASVAALTGTLELDFYKAYATAAGVAGLPQFNWTHTRLYDDEVEFSYTAFGFVKKATSTHVDFFKDSAGNAMFVPPVCQSSTTACGIAWGYAYYFYPGIAEQQVVDNKWRIVLMYPTDLFAKLEDRLVTSPGQALFWSVYPSIEKYSASFLTTPVQLSLPTAKCVANEDGALGTVGVGSHDCDFTQAPLFKVMYDDLDTDKQDARRMFANMLVEQTDYDAMTTSLYTNATVNEASLACKWVKDHTSVWSAWIGVQTPLKHEVKAGATTTNVTYGFLGVFLTMSLACHAFLFSYRGHPVVRRSSHTFAHLIVLGASLLYIALIVDLQETTLGTCVASQFLLSVGFSLFYGSFLVKTWRIDKIFSAAQLRKVTLPDSLLLRYLAAYALADLIIVIIWAGVDPPKPTLEEHDNEAYGYVTVCTSPQAAGFQIAIYVLRGLALLAGAAFAVRIRDVADAYNESKFLAVVTYNILIISAIVLFVSIIGSNDPATVVGLYLIGLALAVVLSVFVFVGTKVAIATGFGAALMGSGFDKMRPGAAEQGHTHLEDDEDTNTTSVRNEPPKQASGMRKTPTLAPLNNNSSKYVSGPLRSDEGNSAKSPTPHPSSLHITTTGGGAGGASIATATITPNGSPNPNNDVTVRIHTAPGDSPLPDDSPLPGQPEDVTTAPTPALDPTPEE